VQDRFDGRRVADGLEKHCIHFEFWEQDRALIEDARFFFIGTSYRDNVDCSMRSGDPGFVRSRRRNGRAGITSKTCSRSTIHIEKASRSGQGSQRTGKYPR